MASPPTPMKARSRVRAGVGGRGNVERLTAYETPAGLTGPSDQLCQGRHRRPGAYLADQRGGGAYSCRNRRTGTPSRTIWERLPSRSGGTTPGRRMATTVWVTRRRPRPESAGQDDAASLAGSGASSGGQRGGGRLEHRPGGAPPASAPAAIAALVSPWSR